MIQNTLPQNQGIMKQELKKSFDYACSVLSGGLCITDNSKLQIK
jgi:hypothetical protein